MYSNVAVAWMVRDGSVKRFWHKFGLMQRYAIGVTLFVVLITGTYVASVWTIQAQDGMSENINLSGRQRMLSQRIQLMAYQLGDPAHPDARTHLNNALNQFETSHAWLIRGGDAQAALPEPLQRLYFDDLPGAALDAEVERFIALARAVLYAAPEDLDGALEDLRAYDAEGLLALLNEAVSFFEAEAVAAKRASIAVNTVGFVLILLVLLLELVLIFRPAQRLLRETLSGLRASNERLTASEEEARRSVETTRFALEEAEAARAEAERASQVKSQFVANMSHEIRTPMNGVIGMAELLSETDQTREQQTFTRTILDSANALLVILNDILDFSKVEAGKVDLRNEVFDPASLAHDVGDLMNALAIQKDVEICVDIAGRVPPALSGDPARLRQILVNLGGNAVKFTSEGHVELSVDYLDTGDMVLEIRDTGIGIPAERLPTIFEAFEQVDTTATRSFQGTGLGLTISRRLTELMGGKISVRSVVGLGTVFRAVIPMAAAEPIAGRPPVDKSLLAGKHVLVVDDLVTNRKILEHRLVEWGCVPHVVDSADGALDYLRDHAETIDVAIIDYFMPQKTGEDLVRAMRAEPAYAEIATILLSSTDMLARVEELKAAGFDRALTKPLRAALLAESMVDLLAGESHEAQTPVAAAPEVVTDLPDMGRDVSVLIVDDSGTNRELLTLMLAGRALVLSQAANGQEAVEMFKAERPEVVLMDLSMPIMDGYEATRRIRAFEAEQDDAPRASILAFTANTQSEDHAAFDEIGGDGILPKPVRKTELLRKLSMVLSKRNTPPERADGV